MAATLPIRHYALMPWPDDWDDWLPGDSCAMCREGRPEETPHGVRILRAPTVPRSHDWGVLSPVPSRTVADHRRCASACAIWVTASRGDETDVSITR